MKTALEVYKAVAENFAYGPFYNLGGSVLGTIGGKAVELMTQAEKAKAAASYVRGVLSKVETLVPKLKQALTGLAPGSDEAKQLAGKIDELEEGARKLAQGADELDDVAKHGGDLADETQIIIAESPPMRSSGVGNSWRAGDEPATLDEAIQAKINSTNLDINNRRADILEGEVATMVRDRIIRFDEIFKRPDNTVLGQIDIETPQAIIEVTRTAGQKWEQIRNFLSDPVLNPTGKPVILYGPRYTSKGFEYIRTQLQQAGIDPNRVTLVKTQQELLAELNRLVQLGQ